jgi:pimeloyl-ACP methyl ester carboxylesterase
VLVERVVLVHGSVIGGAPTWSAQAPLRDRFELVVVERPGFPPNASVDRVDFADDAVLVAGLLEPGDHLVGHSYGGVISLLAAARRPEALTSLTVVEPPATRVAAGNPAVDAFAAGAEELWKQGPTDDPEAYLNMFLVAVGSDFHLPSPLSSELQQGVRMLVRERLPTEADIPLEALAAAPFPKLVVSGAHHAAFDAICDVLERDLGAERAVLRGNGHSVQRHREFNAVLADFVERAAGP